jgi:hypothetical protein
VMSLLEAARYSGVVSSHSWSTPDVVPRIYDLGGVITPYAGSSTGFVKAWSEIRTKRNPKYYFGFGYGADMNGFGAQGGPRVGSNPVKYPFKSFDGKVTLDRQRSGQRVFDINEDGVAHYGLYPDWIEDLRKIAGDQIVTEMSRGAEAYLQMWERAEGIPAGYCRTATSGVSRLGLGKQRLGDATGDLLRRAGQPESRVGRVWRWCVGGRGGKVLAVFTPGERVGLVASTAPRHRARGVGTGALSRRLRGRARRFGKGLLVRSAGRGTKLVYGVRGGRVRFVAVASRSVSRTPARLRGYLRLAGLR